MKQEEYDYYKEYIESLHKKRALYVYASYFIIVLIIEIFQSPNGENVLALLGRTVLITIAISIPLYFIRFFDIGATTAIIIAISEKQMFKIDNINRYCMFSMISIVGVLFIIFALKYFIYMF